MARAKAFFMMAKTGVRRIFSTRNVIIISEKKIDHVSISVRKQLLILSTGIAFVAWVGYCTGSYMAAQSVLEEKDQKIVRANEEKQRVDREFSLLQHDLKKFSKGKSPSSDDYSKFVMAQYGSSETAAPAPVQQATAPAPTDKDRVTERVAFLERRLEQMKKENEQFIATLREKTAGKIDVYEDVLATTGLDTSKLKRVAAIQDGDTKRPVEKNTKKRYANQGGPFVPADFNALDEQKGLKKDIDRLMKLDKLVKSLPLASPVGRRHVSSGFGTRVDPMNHRLAMHTGIDFQESPGTQVRCPNAGRVISAGSKGAYGNEIEITHGYGISTRYAHLQKILVKVGQQVKKGDVIATTGNTGRSTGPHLHYEVRYHNQPYNPARFLEAGNHVLQASK